jgi:hypothetical protein
MTCESAATGILAKIVGIHRLQSHHFSSGGRHPHGTGDVEHQIKVNVGRQRVARCRLSGERDRRMADNPQKERGNLSRERQRCADGRPALGNGSRSGRAAVTGVRRRAAQIRIEEVLRVGSAV